MLLRRHKQRVPVTKTTYVPESAPEVKEEKIEEVVSIDESTKKYTKTEILRMNKETLIEKANEIGVKDADELSGNVLKDKLIEHYV